MPETQAPYTKFRKKPVIVEAITFDQLVEYGRAAGTSLHNGVPWHFEYKGRPITHENDDCYLIPTLEGTMRMGREDMLITGVNGEIYPCKREIFDKTYEPVSSTQTTPMDERLQFLLAAVTMELHRAQRKHGDMASPHEGYAVLKEELEELWDEIKHDAGRSEAAVGEARQVAAMALKYILNFDPNYA